MGARPATTPSRGFTPGAFGVLARETRRQLCQALVVEQGLRIREVVPGGEFDDLIVDVAPLWGRRVVRVRCLYRPLVQADVSTLDATTRAQGESDAYLVEAAAASRESIAASAGVTVLRSAEAVARIEASALVTWVDNVPQIDRTLFEFARSRLAFVRADSMGLRWLPWLARNKRPPDLPIGGPPDALFEEMTFKLFTRCFRLGGRRLGSTVPGAEAPDALLHLPAGSQSVLLDCKAARDGYRMTAAHYRAIRDYVQTMKPLELSAGRALTHVLIVSSSFPGLAGARHPYFGRARRLQSDAQIRLAYLRADDLVRFAFSVEERDMSLAEREALLWSDFLDSGLVTSDDLRL
jgi:hypothetical protein